jgi:hypothetical protein
MQGQSRSALIRRGACRRAGRQRVRVRPNGQAVDDDGGKQGQRPLVQADDAIEAFERISMRVAAE